MRKIESLQENERVFVKSKQWREAAKLFNFCAMPLEPVYVGKNDVGYFWEVSPPEGLTVYPLKDFLPVKKSKTKQRLKALEARVDKIEERTPKRLNQCLNFNEVIVGRKDEPNLEVGKWYNAYYEHNGIKFALLYITEISDESITHYGIHYEGLSGWRDNCTIGKHNKFEPATDKEVEEALINEAKRRGFVEGVKYKSPSEANHEAVGFGVIEGNFKYCNEPNDGIYCKNVWVCINGKWATIIQPKEIDFSVAGQLVVDKNNMIVLTTGLHDEVTFGGTLLAGIDTSHSLGWLKHCFTLSPNPITINPQP